MDSHDPFGQSASVKQLSVGSGEPQPLSA
ncbi:MAG: hypothetical protein ACJA1R_001484, partial [Flavobacteriales bacterium]